MVLILAIILALVLPYPANLVVLVLGAVGEVGEIVWGRRLAKRWRPKVGAETYDRPDRRGGRAVWAGRPSPPAR